jgi:hypothetical protein
MIHVSMMKTFDWDNATVVVRVPTHFTATSQVDEIELPIASFARLLLTNVPDEWFAQTPVSSDLPLAIEISDPEV